jgi:antitoxin FitA
MRTRYGHVVHMSVTIQIRDVPDPLHRQLKSRAALAGLSLSDYLLGELGRIAERPTLDEMRTRLASRSGFNPLETAVDDVRAKRDDR